jgi:hypothetical protein
MTPFWFRQPYVNSTLQNKIDGLIVVYLYKSEKQLVGEINAKRSITNSLTH